MAGFLDRSVCGEILNRWKTMSPSVRREAVEVLFSRTEGIDALLSAIESRSLAPSEIDPDSIASGWRRIQTRHFAAVPRRSWPRVQSPSRDRAQVVSDLSAGDADGG